MRVIMIVARACRHIHVDKSSQAVVLAEIAPCIFIAGSAIANVAHRVQPDERGPLAIVPQAQCFLCSPDGSGLATVLVNDNLRYLALGAEARLDEVHLSLYHRQVVLRAALQNKARTQRSQIWNAGYVEKDILRQHICESGQDLFRTPPLALEVHNIGLHEDRAAIAERGHGLGSEGNIGKFLYLFAKTFRSRLQKVAVSRRALCIELEVLHPAVLEDDQLNVLPANINDDVRIVIELKCRFRLLNRLHQSHVCVHHILQDVFRVSGRAYTQNLKRGAFALDLFPQLLEHLDPILDRVAIRKLAGLTKNFALLAQQDRLGGSGTPIDADKTRNRLAWQEFRGDELFLAVFLLESHQLGVFCDQAFAAGTRFFFCPAVVDVIEQLFYAEVLANGELFILAELDRSKGGKVLRVFWNLDQLLRLHAFRNFNLALLPHERNICLPRFTHSLDEAIGAAQQQYMWAQGVSARKHAQILQHNGFKQRRH